MNLLKKNLSEWSLRLGIAGTYFYSGYDLITHPKSWTQFVPHWFSQLVTSVMPLDLFVQLQGAAEVLIALIFLAWFIPKSFVKIFALVSVLELFAILLFFGIDLVTFRDIGLLGAALGLFFLLSQQNHGSESVA